MKILNEIVLFNKGNIKSQITPQLDIIHKSIKNVTNSGNKSKAKPHNCNFAAKLRKPLIII